MCNPFVIPFGILAFVVLNGLLVHFVVDRVTADPDPFPHTARSTAHIIGRLLLVGWVSGVVGIVLRDLSRC